MITVLGFFCVHAVFMALFILGVYTFDTEGLTQVQFIGASAAVLCVIAAIYLWLHEDKPKTLKAYLAFPSAWVVAFVLTVIFCLIRSPLLSGLNVFLNFSKLSIDFLAMASFIAFISALNYLKRFMSNPQDYDTKVSWLVRKLPLAISTILYSLGMHAFLSVKNIHIIEMNAYLSLQLTLWVIITTFVAIVMFVDKLPKSGMGIFAHMIFFVCCFLGASLLFYPSIAHIDYATLMQSEGFLTMITVLVEFMCIGTLFTLTRSYYQAPVKVLGHARCTNTESHFSRISG